MTNIQKAQSAENFAANTVAMQTRFLAAIGSWTLGFLRRLILFLSDAVAVIWQSCRPTTWRRPVRSEFMRQCYQVGARALSFIAVSGVFVGFGIVAQALHWLEIFGGTALFGGLLSVVLVREIAPVLVGLIVIGRSGSVILVELTTMKAEGQIHALDAQGVDPFVYFVVPRVLAFSICMFCLTIVFVAVAMLAGYASGTLVGIIGFDFLDFMDKALGSIGQAEYLLIMAKTFVIGFVVALISCRTALSLKGGPSNVLDVLPRGFARSVLATLVISVALTLLF